MGTCGQPGYVFGIFVLNRVSILLIFVLNRVFFLGQPARMFYELMMYTTYLA